MSRTFYFQHMLKKHGKELPGLKRYACSHCERVEYTSESYKAHLMLHTDERYVCRDCGYATRFDANLIKHARHVHKKKVTNASEMKLAGPAWRNRGDVAEGDGD
jgi:transposase-like protein